MHIRNLNRFILILALVSGLAACAASNEKPAPTSEQIQLDTADQLAADALAAYHLQRDGVRTLSLMAAATRQAPKRADLAYLQLSLCKAIEGCQPEPYEAQVRKLDPGNAIIWARVLELAQQRRDTAIEMQVLDIIGRAQKFDAYWNSLSSSVTAARIAKGTGSHAALSETVGWLGETIVPSFQPFTIACSRSRTAQAQWTERCRKVAQQLMGGDTYIAETIGLKIAQQVTPDTLEQTRFNQRALTSRYLWRESGTIINSQIERDKFATEMLKLMRQLRREQDVQLAIVRWAGRPVTPPEGWVDE